MNAKKLVINGKILQHNYCTTHRCIIRSLRFPSSVVREIGESSQYISLNEIEIFELFNEAVSYQVVESHNENFEENERELETVLVITTKEYKVSVFFKGKFEQFEISSEVEE